MLGRQTRLDVRGRRSRTPVRHGDARTRTWTGDIHRFAGRVPAAGTPGGRYRLDIRVPRTARPCDAFPGSTDTRELGVAVSRIELGFE